VKWLVEMFDETEEPLVGIATILTMWQKGLTHKEKFG
jgi:hypothetical protein